MADTIKGNWSNESAFNLVLALEESRNWIEAVVGQKFPSDDFQQSLKNGVFLCKLINQIQPNIVKKINNAPSDFAQRENVSLFIKACKELGLRDTQVFDTNDLFEAKRIRNVAIALYWLGRAARGIPGYKGPHLNLLAFKKMNCTACKRPIEDNNYLATLDQQWHTKCAHCCVCHDALNPAEQFYQNGGKIYCPNCMVAANKGVSGQGGKGKGHGDGHEHCAGCHKNIDRQDHVPKGDLKYCTSCICDLCHNPLVGNFSVKNGKKYCDTCTCFDCGCPLQEGYMEEGNLRFCEPCFKKHAKSAPVSSAGPASSAAKSAGPTTSGPAPSKAAQEQKAVPSSARANATPCCKVCDKPVPGKPQKGGDRNQYCPIHENDYCCTACDKEMSGPIVEAQGKRYHPNCHKGAKSGAGGAKHTCGGCARPIESGPAVEALDKMWHPKCFTCAKCGSDFPDGSYSVGPDGKPYCAGCDGQDGGEAEYCHGCKKQLSGQVTQVFGKMWHQGCLKCRKCSDKFVTGYFDFEGIPYCKPCHHIMSKADKCTKCDKVIEGECVQMGGKLYHKACFVCFECAKPIPKDDVHSKSGKPICRSCNDKATCAKCRNSIVGDTAQVDNKSYCAKCAPPKTTTIYGEKKAGFTIDPRSGKKTFH